MASQGRRQRRAYLKAQGILELKRNLPLKKWLSITGEFQERGKEMHQKFLELQEKLISEQLEVKETSLVATWKEIGYNDEEIQKLREANAITVLRDRSSWKEEKKVARKLMKEAQLSMAQRNQA